MNSKLQLILWFLFLGSFGFAGGGYFLLFFIVPFEEWLVSIDFTQREIDETLRWFVYGWVGFGFIVSFLYYVFVLRKQKSKLAYVLVSITIANALLVGYFFLNTNSALIALSQGTVSQESERFTFGPYPDETIMKQLKEEGYDGIITLLSPTIPFENQLLDTEQENGKQIGLTIHSLPMLPWIGDNKESIQKAKALANDSNKRYYVHCYLGKHRVDMIKQVILEELGDEAEQIRRPVPSIFERGNVYSYRDEQIILGPFPSDEEWFKLLRSQVKEVVSILDSNNPWNEQIKKVSNENGIKVTLFPLDSEHPDPIKVKQIVEYVKARQHKVFIHGSSKEPRIEVLDIALRTGLIPTQSLAMSTASANQLLKINRWSYIGPFPNQVEWEKMKKAGISSVVFLDDGEGASNQKLQTLAQQQAKRYGLSYQTYRIDSQADVAQLYQIAHSLYKENHTFYIFFDKMDEKSKMLHRIMQGMYLGIDKSIESYQPDKGSIIKNVRDRDQILGSFLSPEEWKQFILPNGIGKVIIIDAASLTSREQLKEQEEIARKFGVDVQVIPLFEDYRQLLFESIKANRKTMYIMVPEEIQHEVKKALTDK